MSEPGAPAVAQAASPTFDVMPLGPEVRRAIDAMGYRHPTPVQVAVFEPAAEGRSLVVQARTGTGKTAAFGMPIIDRLVRTSIRTVQALVLCPTRELAVQVCRELDQIGQFRATSVVAIYGGAPMGRQVEALKNGAQIVVGTPGRVLDHLRQKTLDPTAIRTLVLDEADEMLSMGFARELNAIIETLPKTRQGLFFSATIPPDIERLAHTHLRNAEMVTLSSDQVGALEIAHYVYFLQSGDKVGQLVRVLEVEDPESAIIFCNTRDETQRVADALKGRGFDADWLNGDLPQTDRERVMSATREGRLRFLVATDVAARGIDVSHLTHVINYDFPESAEQYVHRTGRTGRAGRTGTALSFVGPKDIGALYLLRLTYKIRPIERQLPSAGEMKTRAEMDLLEIFIEAFGHRPVHPDDRSLARRLLTHDDAEGIVAGLLRDHLGARGEDVAGRAAEQRRARNPEPRTLAERESSAARGPEPDRRPPAAHHGRDASARRMGASRSREPLGARDPLRSAAIASSGWRPPAEPDDDAPILTASRGGQDPPLPGYSVGEAPSPAAHSPPDQAGHGQAGDYLELFVNVGRREGLRSADVQALLEDKGIAHDDTGRIRVRDRMTFISVKKDALDRVVAAFSGQVIAGRTVVAELARARA